MYGSQDGTGIGLNVLQFNFSKEKSGDALQLVIKERDTEWWSELRVYMVLIQ